MESYDKIHIVAMEREVDVIEVEEVRALQGGDCCINIGFLLR